MAYEPNNNSGSLFRNDEVKSDKHPTHSGSALVDGKEYWISAWVKDGKKGKFFSMAFKPKDGGRRQTEPVERGGSYAEDLGDEIPFLPERRG